MRLPCHLLLKSRGTCVNNYGSPKGVVIGVWLIESFVVCKRLEVGPTENKTLLQMMDLLGQDLNDAVDTAIKAGLMSMSEIVFNRDHRLAAFQVPFRCGRLCGHGSTVIYEEGNGRRRRSKRRCGSWQS